MCTVRSCMDRFSQWYKQCSPFSAGCYEKRFKARPISSVLPTLQTLIPILRVRRFIPQNIPPQPPPKHNPHYITHRSSQPPRPRQRQRHLCRIRKEQQLRQTRLHALPITIIQIAINIPEKLLVGAVRFGFIARAVGRCLSGDFDGAGFLAGVVDFEGVACCGGDVDGLRVCSGEFEDLAFEGENVAAAGYVEELVLVPVPCP